MDDQAERLRQMVRLYKTEVIRGLREQFPRRRRHTHVIAVTSGKGGVGKTNFSVNLAYALRARGQSVLLVDADLGLANVDVLLGTEPPGHLGHLVARKRRLTDLIYEAPGGVKLVAGGSGVDDLVDLPEAEIHRVVRELTALEDHADYMLIDTSAGVGRGVTSFLLAADQVVVVTTPEPTALADAYALIKLIVRQQPAARIGFVVNQAQNVEEAEQAAVRLRAAVLQFLGAVVDPLGAVPFDRAVPRSVRSQQPFLVASPDSPASHAVRAITGRLMGDGVTVPFRGLFFDRLARVMTRLARG